MESFDAYRKWLGIPPEEQPPNHYRLLGIGLFESDPDVISNAADRQMAHVRSFQTGRHSELSQQILNELSSARLCLLDPARKASYDAELREQLSTVGTINGAMPGTVLTPPPAAPPPAAPPTPAAGPSGAPPVQPPAVPPPNVPVVPLGPTSTARGYNHRRRQRAAWRALASVVIVLVVISLGLIAWAVSTGTWPRRSHPPETPGTRMDTLGGASAQTTGRQPADQPDAGPAGSPRTQPQGPPGQSSPVSGGPLPIPGLEQSPSVRPGESLAEPVGLKHELRGHRGPVAGVAFSPDSQTVLSGGEDGTLRLWDAIAGGELRRFVRKPPAGAQTTTNGRATAPDQPAPSAPAAVPNQETPSDSAVAPSQPAPSDPALLPVLQVCFVPPDGQSVLASRAQLNPPSGGVVRAFSVTDGKPTHEIKLAGALAAWDVSVSPDGKRLALACEDSTIALLAFAVEGGATRELRRAAGHEGPVRSVAFSPDCTQLLSAGDDQTVRLWDAETGEQIRAMLGHQGPVRSVAFSPDGHYGISGGDDGLVWVWKLNDGTRTLAFKGHTAGVTCVAWSADGRRVLSGSADGTIRLWNVSDGSELCLFRAHSGGVRAVDLAANGHQAVSCGNDGLVKLWNLPDSALPGQDAAGAAIDSSAGTGSMPPAGTPANVPARDGLGGATEGPAGETSSAESGGVGRSPVLSAIEGLDCRGGTAKAALLEYYGGDDQTEAAVERALQWLVRHQQSDGHWSFAHQTPDCAQECPNPGTLSDAPRAATALALMALLGAGHTPQAGSLRKEVNDGLTWLRRHMFYGGPWAAAYEPEAQGLPGHAWATIVLCETSQLVRDRANSLTASKAVQFIALTQNADGGWGDHPAWKDEAADTSNPRATAWNLLALAAAHRASLRVPAATFERALRYSEQATTGSGRGLRKLLTRTKDPVSKALLALAGHRLGWADEGAGSPALLSQLGVSEPDTSGAFCLNWIHSELLRDCGGPEWEQWNMAMRRHLLDTQQAQGHGAGSWFVDAGEWGNREGGRLFCTALGALTLEVYYRYPPPAHTLGTQQSP